MDTEASDLLKEQLAWLKNYSETNPKELDGICNDNGVKFSDIQAMYTEKIDKKKENKC